MFRKLAALITVFVLFATLATGGCGVLKAKDNPKQPSNSGYRGVANAKRDTYVTAFFTDYSETLIGLYDWADLAVTGRFGNAKASGSHYSSSYEFFIDSILYGSHDDDILIVNKIKDETNDKLDVFRTFLLFLKREQRNGQERFYIVGGEYQGVFFDSHGELGGLCPRMVESAQGEYGLNTFEELKDYVLHNSPDR